MVLKTNKECDNYKKSLKNPVIPSSMLSFKSLISFLTQKITILQSNGIEARKFVHINYSPYTILWKQLFPKDCVKRVEQLYYASSEHQRR